MKPGRVEKVALEACRVSATGSGTHGEIWFLLGLDSGQLPEDGYRQPPPHALLPALPLKLAFPAGGRETGVWTIRWWGGMAGPGPKLA